MARQDANNDIFETLNLTDLADVAIVSATNNDFLVFNGTNWVDFNLFNTQNSWTVPQNFSASANGTESIFIAGDIVHFNDSNTLFRFEPDKIIMIAGGDEFLSYDEGNLPPVLILSANNIEHARFQAASLSPAVTVFNETGIDMNHRFEGDTDTSLLFLDASTDRVGIGTSTPQEKLDVSGNVFVDGFIESKEQYACLTLTAGSQVTITQNLWRDILWDNQIRVDNIFSHTVGASGLGIASNGSYMIHCDVSTNVDTSNRNTSKMRLLQNATVIDSSMAFMYNRSAADGKTTGTVNIINNFTSGDNLHVQFTKDDASVGSIATVPDGCRLNIQKI